MERLQLRIIPGNISGSVELPASKSISNRLLIMSYLTDSDNNIQNLSKADDTLQLLASLEEIETCSASRIPMIVNTHNAGTVIRFLTAYLSIKQGKWLLTGTQRMKERPIGILVKALQDLGALISTKQELNYPPLLIEGSSLSGKEVNIDTSISSQFVSALMMIGPYLEDGLVIRMKKKPVSFAYIRMTMKLMQQSGAEVEYEKDKITIQPGTYKMNDHTVEPDWSAASYWYEIVALSKDTEVFLPGLMKDSPQGDCICADLFKQFGVKTIFETSGIRIQKTGKVSRQFESDFTDYPDLVPAIAATCLGLKIPAVLHGVGHLKYKESDRIRSLTTEFSKLGAKLELKDGSLNLTSPQSLNNEERLIFDTYKDHRIAMCIAPLVLKLNTLTINDPKVVSKSYPGFWDDLKNIGLVDFEEN